MELSLRESSSEVALRNEEVNRARLQAGRSGSGPLKVTDPAAFQRLMADMAAKAEEQRRVEEEREAERKKREGAAYKTPEERAKEAKDAKAAFKDGEEARSVDDGRFDPSKDYYAILGVDRAASAAQIRQKYKRLALLYHPDKHKAESEEARAAVAAAFREVAFAFDVLTDEEQRALYDKCRDWTEGGRQGLPPLSPEEAARMASGAAELRKLRKMGPKLAKHPPLQRDVEISLMKLNSGCTRAVAVQRRRCDYAGKEHVSTKTFHLVVRKGSREGDRLVFPDDGDETVDTHAGDLIFTLRAKPHPTFRRRGEKDLEIFAAAVPAGDVVYAAEVETLSGGRRVVIVPALRAALESGGMGGVWHCVLPGQGLFDAKEPWDAPPGDLHVQLRYPAVLLRERRMLCTLRPGPVVLLGSADEPIPAALAAGYVASRLCHASEARHMASDYAEQPPPTRIVWVTLAAGRPGAAAMAALAAGRPGPAATAALAALRAHVPGAIIECATLELPGGAMEDAAWAALYDADAVILDVVLPEMDTNIPSDSREAFFSDLRRGIEVSGVGEALWQRHWLGAVILACGPACSLLGRDGRQPDHITVLPWYAVRPGGGAAGWQDAAEAAAAAGSGGVAVGVLETSVYLVDGVTGCADLLVAPCKEALVARAAWGGPTGAAAAVEESEEDFGFFGAAFVAS